ncbi:MAG: hypothetical protein JSU00_07960 [Acidobacteria bacterium]|nr:hypothetical protein [Acidobacteriota bacterium]
MLNRVLLVVLCAGIAASAQMKLSVEQLKQFIQSSVAMKQDDRKVAQYLKKVQLTSQLDAATVEDLQGLGAGPRTVEALKALMTATAAMPKAAPPPPKPAYVPPPSPTSEEQGKVLQDAREYALNYTSRLPDFICTQVTRRFVDPTGLESWIRQDVITERLSYFDKHEDYKVVLVNSRPVEMAHDKLGGATSSGEFGSVMREIFDPTSETRFEWERWGTLRGHRMHVFSYRVEQSRSQYSIYSEEVKQRIIAAYHGLIYVDKETSAVMKITLSADEIPSGFPVREVNLSLDYDHVSISDHEFILPLKAVLTSRQGAKYLNRNEVEFRMYRKFSAESTIKAVDVETPDALPAEATKEQAPPPPVKK